VVCGNAITEYTASKFSSKKHLKRLGDGKGIDYLCRRFRRKRIKLSWLGKNFYKKSL
jgi:hypothetical protein